MRYLFLILLILAVFFKPFFFNGKLPIPSDTLVGMYHPWRDALSDQYPNGIPFKNFLITDPIRQQIPWKYLAIEQLKKKTIPWWNSYSFSGTPLLANFQSGVFYPLNITFFLVPNFKIAWSIFILIQLVLGGWFMYLFLRNLQIKPLVSFFGSISWIFSGFWIAWLEWGNILHTALWLPLVLWAIDRKRWLLLLIVILCSFFAGHLQTFFYLWLFTIIYSIFRKTKLKQFLIFNLVFLILSVIQWLPTLQFILQSGRISDINNVLTRNDWFLPWQHLIQFIAPDFFGNPATLNYWGIWNYGEMVGYVGVIGLILAIYATTFSFKKNREVKFFTISLIVILIFILPTPLAKLPFLLNIPFLSTSQPTRLLFLVDFLLVILSAYGLEQLFNHIDKKRILIIMGVIGIIFLILWLVVMHVFPVLVSAENLSISKNNLKLPTIIFMIAIILLLTLILINNQRIRWVLILCLIVLSFTDQMRFANKFTAFTNQEYFYPLTKTIEFLQNDKDNFRIMSIDDRIMPPNVSIMYGLKDIAGYDPLYLKTYAEKINTMDNRQPGSGFSRIITPKNYDSSILEELRVKYILSLNDIESSKLKKVFQEGQTKIYLNKSF